MQKSLVLSFFVVAAASGWLDLTLASVADLHEIRSIDSDIKKIIDLVPMDKFMTIFLELLEYDVEFSESIYYAKSDEFKAQVQKLDNLPTFIEYLDFLQERNIPSYTYLNSIRSILGLPPFPGTREEETRSIMPLIENVLRTLPIRKMLNLYYELMQTSPEFRDLINLPNTPEYQAKYTALMNDPVYVSINDDLVAHGIDLFAIEQRTLQYFTHHIINSRL